MPTLTAPRRWTRRWTTTAGARLWWVKARKVSPHPSISVIMMPRRQAILGWLRMQRGRMVINRLSMWPLWRITPLGASNSTIPGAVTTNKIRGCKGVGWTWESQGSTPGLFLRKLYIWHRVNVNSTTHEGAIRGRYAPERAQTYSTRQSHKNGSGSTGHDKTQLSQGDSYEGTSKP